MNNRIPARVYNKDYGPRRTTPDRRRVSTSRTRSYAWENNRDPSHLDNGFSTFPEMRRVAWPQYEDPQWAATSSCR